MSFEGEMGEKGRRAKNPNPALGADLEFLSCISYKQATCLEVALLDKRKPQTIRIFIDKIVDLPIL